MRENRSRLHDILAACEAIADPWGAIARMRDHLAHRYFDTTHAIVFATARHDVLALEAAVRRLLAR